MDRSINYRCKKKKAHIPIFAVAAVVIVAVAGCRPMPLPSGTSKHQGDRPAIAAGVNGPPMVLETSEGVPDLSSVDADAKTGTPAPEEHDLDFASPLPTFKETGRALCTDDEGRPLLLFFSAASCAHCQWVEGVFTLIAREYAGQGLVTAHHYDTETGDDLLTETVETRIPEKHLSIGKRGNPDGYMPYFSFGCRYDRIGTGYEVQGDLAAEAEEMCRVIEALLP